MISTYADGNISVNELAKIFLLYEYLMLNRSRVTSRVMKYTIPL